MSYFHHNFKNIPCYVMSEASLKRFYFALFDDGLPLKTLKLEFIGFLIQTLQLYPQIDNYGCATCSGRQITSSELNTKLSSYYLFLKCKKVYIF